MDKKINPIKIKRNSLKTSRAKKTPYTKFLEEYKDIRTRENKIVTEYTIKHISDEIKKWADKDDSFFIADFYDGYGIPERRYMEWLEKYPEIKEANEYSKRRIRARREFGGMSRKYDPSFIYKSMGMYSDEWMKYNKLMVELAKIEDKPQNITIQLPDITKD